MVGDMEEALFSDVNEQYFSDTITTIFSLWLDIELFI